ncbi:MAG: RNA methyltransferase [Elusimicrobiota bacterium]
MLKIRAEQFKTVNRVERIKKVVTARQECVVVLEDIYDPHNAEAVFRSCDAFGVQKVCLIFEHEKKFNPRKVGKSTSSSANKWLDFMSYDSTEMCLSKLKTEGYTIIATAFTPDAVSLYESDISSLAKPVLMFGNEHRGLSEKAVELADIKIIIPMRGFVQSLNLSVTAAICMYELTRQRITAKNMNKSLLSVEEQKKLYDELIKK